MPAAIDADIPPSPDPLDPAYDDAYISRIFAVVADTPDLTFRIATGRLDRLADLLDHGGRKLRDAGSGAASGDALDTAEWPPPNLRIGTVVRTPAELAEAVAALPRIPAAGRFLRIAPDAAQLDLTEVASSGIGVVYLDGGLARDRHGDLYGQCGRLGIECIPL